MHVPPQEPIVRPGRTQVWRWLVLVPFVAAVALVAVLTLT